jgi:hypothetical protein
MKSLQEITDAWGQWMLTQYPDGGVVNFTASTNYGDYSRLDQYASWQVVATWGGVTFTPVISYPNGELKGAIVTAENETDVTQTTNFTFSETTQNTTSIQTTQTTNIGESVTGILEIANFGQTYTINSEAMQDSQISITTTWTLETPIVVPARSSIYAQLIVITQQLDMTWSGSIVMSGYVAIWFANQVTLAGWDSAHWLWFIPISQVFSDCIANNLIDLTGYTVDGWNVTTAVTGTLAAQGGIDAHVSWTVSPISTSTEDQPGRSYSVPLSRKLRPVPGTDTPYG